MSQRRSDLEPSAIDAIDEVRTLDHQRCDCKDRRCDERDEREDRSLKLFSVSRVMMHFPYRVLLVPFFSHSRPDILKSSLLANQAIVLC